jgi:hypothetical protein
MRWAAPSGPVFTLRPPARAGDYLDGLAHALAPVGFDPSVGLAALLEWTAAHVTEATLSDGVRVPVDADMLDGLLMPVELGDLARAVIDAAGLSAAFIEEARGYFDVVAGGGCECRSCAGVDPDDARGCLYAPFDPGVCAAATAWLPLREVKDYDMPVWAYQLASVWEAAVSTVRRAAREQHEAERAERESRRHVHEYARGQFASRLGIKF